MTEDELRDMLSYTIGVLAALLEADPREVWEAVCIARYLAESGG